MRKIGIRLRIALFSGKQLNARQVTMSPAYPTT
jgi:hypothetical protein